MVLSGRAILIRNGATAIVNGAITLVLLLIAPLGLAGVITNTLAVTVSTFVICGVMDLITLWLVGGKTPAQLGMGNRPRASNLNVLWEHKGRDRFPDDRP
ncbi:MAG: hypothetical protein HC796_12350 [Synechococcaceae cyanobacterium RL_1_2]|nr:hypothetical protein [Synechococcaceae cyanobacterium RL_1_2]